ncbi:DUF177 domain-containing protein [Rothia sp. p3-SID1597]|nr:MULTISPECIES: DUF177 domain-containing protein [Kocuria]MCT1368334.1 DUF177 domain-containing protein [Rothia sp. p3-SID1597]
MTVSVRELAKRPGSTEHLDETVTVPQDFGNPQIGAPEGSDITLDLRLESVHDGIFVNGVASVNVHGECSRCLDPIDYPVTADIQELYVFEREPQGQSQDEADEQYCVENDSIDLEPVLRDAVITQLPFQPVCREDCQGLCSECGVRLDENPDHHHENLDPRWSALSGLFGAETANETTETREER